MYGRAPAGSAGAAFCKARGIFVNKMKKSISLNTLLSMLLLVVFLALLVMAVSLVRQKLLQNTQDLGMSLAQSYGAEEEMYIKSFRQYLELGSEHVEEMWQEGASPEEIQLWLHDYFRKLITIVGEDTIDPYAVLDGKIVAANPWEGDEGYEYQSAPWYRQALEAEGEIIFTDAYQDVITGRVVITAAKKFDFSEDVLALDLYPEYFHQADGIQNLPDGASLYLCDENGTLIYYSTQWEVPYEKLQFYTDQLLKGIRDGSLSAYDASFQDPAGVERGVYYYTMNQGWTVMLTMPFQSVLMGDRNLTIWVMTGISALLFLILAGMVVRDLIHSKRIERAANTIQILGDSFYAIYRVNYRTGTYESIKTAEDLHDRMPPEGSYSTLLATMKTLVDPETYQEFAQAFSLESIRQRVDAAIPDYGGDYQRRFGDTYKWVNIRTLYDGKQAPDEVILCFREVDIEKRQQLQHTLILREALDTAKKSTKAKSAFFSSMSHDLRTPLNAIIGLSELAQQHKGEWDKVMEYIRKIELSGKQMLALVNDILELSRLESGRHTMEYKEFDLRQCLEDTLSLFKEQIEREEKHLHVQIDLTDRRVMGDPFKLSQILNNLISNAIKYSESGAEIRVSLRQYDFQKHSKYQFVVEDTGIGMSPSFLEHIFDPYARETHFTKRSTTGTGLGMPIVKSLVQQMSGEIAVESTLGKGSRFTVTLPMIPAEGSAPEQQPAQEPEPLDLAGKRVILAEDNELNMEIATELLQMNEVEVIQTRNGAEAVAAFQSAAPYAIDAILMDMQMPVMDGCEAARTIRHLDKPDAASVPIIAVTANAFTEDIAKTTEAGMNAHISKPIDFGVLCRTLAELTRKDTAR